jgi:crossover junction endodeoxyribonuclease RuvC
MFVGIDPSLSGTAVACYGGEVIRLSSPTCEPGVRNRIMRYTFMARHVSKTVRGFSDEPDVIFIEGYSFGSKHGGEKLAEYGGILRLTLLQDFVDTPIIEVMPLSLKKFITGAGKGKKIALIGAIASKYGVTFDSDDEYDAYGLALMAAAYGGEFEMTNQQQRDVIAQLRDGPKKKSRKKKAA